MLPAQSRMARAAHGLSVRKLAVAAKVFPHRQSFALSVAKNYEPSSVCVRCCYKCQRNRFQARLQVRRRSEGGHGFP